MGDLTCRGKVMCDQDSCSCLPGYAATKNWENTCMLDCKLHTLIWSADNTYIILFIYSIVNSTKLPTIEDDIVQAEGDEEEEVNLEHSGEYLYTLDEAAEEQHEGETKIWWILAIMVSWVIAVASVFLVIKERPDLVPMCILNPILRCTGQNQGGDQLINEDA